jgi:maltose O-acetyltransferase
MGTCVLPGVTIGEGCVVGAGSVVATDLPDFTVSVGNPARVVRERAR